MTTLPESVESSAVPLEGRLGDPATMPRLFAWLARGEWSGMLVLRAGDVERRIYFVEGRVGTAGSTDPAESLSACLIREGLLTEEQRSRAAGQLRTPDRGWSFGRQLVRAGLLQEGDLQRVERRRVVQLAESALGLRTGTYACEAGTHAGDAQPQQALEVPRLVAEGILTLWDANSALEVLGGRHAVLDMVVEHLPDHEATGADEPYDYTLLLCNGQRTLEELMGLSPLPEAASLRFLAALRLLDIVACRSVAPPAPRPEAATTPVAGPEPQAVASAAAGAASVARVAEPDAWPPRSAAAAPLASGTRDDAASAPATPAASRVGEATAPAPARESQPARDARATVGGPAGTSAAGRAASPARPAPRAAGPPTASAGTGSRTAWILAIVAVLIAASAFFLWVGWKTMTAKPAPGEAPGGGVSMGRVAPSAPPVDIAPPAPDQPAVNEASPPARAEPTPEGSSEAERPAGGEQPVGATGAGPGPAGATP